MSDIEYIIPGSGLVNDTETDSQIIIPEFGVYNEQESSVPPTGNPYWYYNMLRRR